MSLAMACALFRTTMPACKPPHCSHCQIMPAPAPNEQLSVADCAVRIAALRAQLLRGHLPADVCWIEECARHSPAALREALGTLQQ
jgi:hypothetical protein